MKHPFPPPFEPLYLPDIQIAPLFFSLLTYIRVFSFSSSFFSLHSLSLTRTYLRSLCAANEDANERDLSRNSPGKKRNASISHHEMARINADL